MHSERGASSGTRATRAIEVTTKLREERKKKEEERKEWFTWGSKARTRDSVGETEAKRREEARARGMLWPRAGGAPERMEHRWSALVRELCRVAYPFSVARSRFQPIHGCLHGSLFYPRAFARVVLSSFASSTPAVLAVVGPFAPFSSPPRRAHLPVLPVRWYRHRHQAQGLPRLPSNPFTVAQGHAAGPAAETMDNGDINLRN